MSRFSAVVPGEALSRPSSGSTSAGFFDFLLICLLMSYNRTCPGFVAQSAQRIRPPEKINCSRDHLTSYTGKVLSMKQQRGSTRIWMRTDEETSEQFTLRDATDNPSEYFWCGEKAPAEATGSRLRLGGINCGATCRPQSGFARMAEIPLWTGNQRRTDKLSREPGIS